MNDDLVELIGSIFTLVFTVLFTGGLIALFCLPAILLVKWILF